MRTTVRLAPTTRKFRARHRDAGKPVMFEVDRDWWLMVLEQCRRHRSTAQRDVIYLAMMAVRS